MIPKIVGAGAVLLVMTALWVIWALFQGFALGDCDPKFGCLGGVLVAALFGGVAGVISAIAFIVATTLPRLVETEAPMSTFVVAGTIGGIGLAILLPTVWHWYVEMPAMVIGWFMLSLITLSTMFVLLQGIRSMRT